MLNSHCRSPPITAPGPTFPTTQQQFGTIRGTPMAFKSQDAIHVASIRQAPSRPTVAPPRPPIEAAAAKSMFNNRSNKIE